MRRSLWRFLVFPSGSTPSALRPSASYAPHAHSAMSLPSPDDSMILGMRPPGQAGVKLRRRRLLVTTLTELKAIADHRYDRFPILQAFHLGDFSFGEQAGYDAIDPGHLRDRFRRSRVVAGEHHDREPHGAQATNCRRRGRLDSVGDSDCATQHP